MFKVPERLKFTELDMPLEACIDRYVWKLTQTSRVIDLAESVAWKTLTHSLNSKVKSRSWQQHGCRKLETRHLIRMVTKRYRSTFICVDHHTCWRLCMYRPSTLILSYAHRQLLPQATLISFPRLQFWVQSILRRVECLAGNYYLTVSAIANLAMQTPHNIRYKVAV